MNILNIKIIDTVHNPLMLCMRADIDNKNNILDIYWRMIQKRV